MTITITRDDVNGHHVTDGDHTIWISNVTSNGWFIACAAHTDVGCEFQDVENAPTETEQMLHVIDALGVKLDWSQARKITRSNTTTIAHESDRVNQMKARRAVHDEYTTKQRRVEQAERALHYERTILTEIKRDLKAASRPRSAIRRLGYQTDALVAQAAQRAGVARGSRGDGARRADARDEDRSAQSRRHDRRTEAELGVRSVQ